ncbi:putative RNA polymerase [Pseudomonas phage COT4]|uniref:Head-to-tail adaptor n=1 Tax=Pseudomonas phage M5.1 TaxID=2873460 RepID=A0AAE9BNL6_9CAUD|nr:head-to-tail adaptor [Pseudomonas phage M5.1]UAV89664.1 head-to-tail adaptor [Pseudomonas phage M5.1]UGL61264.1 putative RNA polymerase [Pseudomonas phage COT4]
MGFSIKFENKIPSLLKRLDKLDGMEVEVGFFEEDRYGPENHNLPVATVAAYNEFGTVHNPQRPFMSDTFSENMNQLYMAKGMKAAYLDVLKGGVASIRLLNSLGRIAAELMKVSIQQYAAAGGNSYATIKKKGGRDTPLIDTGKMIESVRFHVHR